MTIGFIIYIISQFASSFFTNYYLFSFFYSIVGGVGLGMNVILFFIVYS